MKNLQFLLFYLIFTPVAFVSAQFQDIASTSGFKHNHLAPNLLGGGVAVIDYNNDGLEDLYFTGGTSYDKLYANRGNLKFEEVSVESGVFSATRTVTTTAVATGDIDNDGLEDLFIMTAKNHPLILLKNTGNGSFKNISYPAGVDASSEWAMGASLGDVNRDGLIDIYVVNYIQNYQSDLDDKGNVTGFNHSCYPNLLFINQGDATFLEMAAEYGVADNGCGLATVLTDINNDSYPDIYVANDFGEWVRPNQAYVFDPVSAKFVNATKELHLNDSIYGMGIASGDVNRDGYKDYYITNLGRNVLRVNNGNGIYTDITDEAGVTATEVNGALSTGWGTFFFDYNNDGWEDLFLSNGFIPSADFIATAEADPNGLFVNNGNNTFTDVSTDTGMNFPGTSRGAVWADLDNNGYPDVVVNNVEKTFYDPENNVKIYINNSGTNNWLGIVLEGASSNFNAIGASVEVFHNNIRSKKELTNGSSHASTSSKRLIFGLEQGNQVDSILVRWPSGLFQRFGSITDINKYIKLKENDEEITLLGCNDPEALNYSGTTGSSSWGCIFPDEVVTSLTSEYEPENTFYPNPTTGILLFNGFLKKVRLYDSKGTIVVEQQIEPGFRQLDLSNMQKGLYFVQCTSIDGGTKTSKLILKR